MSADPERVAGSATPEELAAVLAALGVLGSRPAPPAGLAVWRARRRAVVSTERPRVRRAR